MVGVIESTQTGTPCLVLDLGTRSEGPGSDHTDSGEGLSCKICKICRRLHCRPDFDLVQYGVHSTKIFREQAQAFVLKWDKRFKGIETDLADSRAAVKVICDGKERRLTFTHY